MLVSSVSADVFSAALPPASALRASGSHHDDGRLAAVADEPLVFWRGEDFRELTLRLAPAERTLWCTMSPTGRPSYTPKLLAELAHLQEAARCAFRSGGQRPFEYLVLGSATPGVFNLGGDLALFLDKIRQHDRTALREYAYRCVEVLHENYRGLGERITSIALVQGDALGGGFESALSCDLIVAEREARMGFPEILFNLFPGMGAYSFLCRRIGPRKTEEMLRSGNLYTADELHALGIVDLVVDPRQGEAGVRELIRRRADRHNAHAAISDVRRRVHPVTRKELRAVTDLWVDAALRLEEQDLRRISRVVAAQDRARARHASSHLSAGAPAPANAPISAQLA